MRKIVTAAVASSLLALSTAASAGSQWEASPQAASWAGIVMGFFGVTWGR